MGVAADSVLLRVGAGERVEVCRGGSGDASFWGGSDLKAMSIRREIAPMLRLALPLVMAEVGWMSMGVVDTVMVGHLPRPAVTISAVALGQVLYNTLAFGIGGVLLGLDTYISQAHGAGEWDDANKWLLSGVVLAGLLSAVLMGMVWLGPVAIGRAAGRGRGVGCG